MFWKEDVPFHSEGRTLAPSPRGAVQGGGESHRRGVTVNMGQPRASKHCDMTSCQRVGSLEATQDISTADLHASGSLRPRRVRSAARLVGKGLALVAGAGFLMAPTGPLHAYELQDEPDYSRISPLVTKLLEREHFGRQEFNDEVSQGVLKELIAALDYNRLFFLQSDIDDFNKQFGTTLDEKTKAGDLQPAQVIYDLYKVRVQERYDLIQKLLEKEYTFTGTATYQPSRKDAPWAKNAAELEDLWTKRIEGELLLLELAEEKNADRTPKETLKKRYDRLLSTVKENDASDVSVMFLSVVSQYYDPHSSYMSHAQLENFRINMQLSLQGIGAMLNSEDGYARVVELVKGGPAELSGELQVDDKIVEVAQGDKEFVDVRDMKLDDVVQLIRGEKGTIVRLKVIPAKAVDPSERKIVSIPRNKVELKNQAAKADLRVHTDPATGQETRLGWVTIPSFYAALDESGPASTDEGRYTTPDVHRLITRLKKEKIDGLVIDLSSNGGGSLEEAINLTGLFIGGGPVVQVKDPTDIVRVYKSPKAAVVYEGPMVVLVDRSSASASEIFAAALQDYNRAVIVGDSSTFGKGTVQTMLYLDQHMPFWQRMENAGALKLTVQKFYRVAGGSTQLKGVEPDIVLPSAYDYVEYGERALPNPLPYDTVRDAKYASFNRENLYVDELKTRSQKRVQENLGFRLLAEESARMKAQQDKNELSLNLAERKATMVREKEAVEERKAKLKEMATSKDVTYEITLDRVDEEKLVRAEEAEAAAKAEQEARKRTAQKQEGINPDEDLADADEEDDDFNYSHFLREETVNILLDMINRRQAAGKTAGLN